MIINLKKKFKILLHFMTYKLYAGSTNEKKTTTTTPTQMKTQL